MQRIIATAIFAAAWFAAAAVAAQAAPMRCSSEEKICIAACSKMANGPARSMCITNCGQRQAICVKTGCWDGSAQKYCGLLRQ